MVEAVDPEVKELVSLLQAEGVETFSSCSGLAGHAFRCPMVRCKPCDPKRLFTMLIDLGYTGFYVKEYRSAHRGPEVDFIEIEFWSADCLRRRNV